jgi:hypothetical protein
MKKERRTACKARKKGEECCKEWKGRGLRRSCGQDGRQEGEVAECDDVGSCLQID